MTYAPDVKILGLGEKFSDPVAPADFPKTILRYRNQEAAKQVGLDTLSDESWIAHFGRFTPLPDNLEAPLALRYHGHQFQSYNPNLGDGRGFLFAQCRSHNGRLLDLGTKGSGQTPYSRRGDGRLTLLGGIREVLITKYLDALGVNTSKSFSLIETGEALQRNDEPSPTRSAVLVRLSHSHIRFGTFQRAAYEDNVDGLEALTAYCLTHYYPEFAGADQASAPAVLLGQAIKSSADMVASWMAAGFVHGVMNTDNMNITGESFDYGPYRVSPHFDPARTAAYFDHTRLYAFGRQPQIMLWNLGQLAGCLAHISDDQPLIDALDGFAPAYQMALRDKVFARLGIAPSADLAADTDMVSSLFHILHETKIDLAQFYFDMRLGEKMGEEMRAKSPQASAYKADFKDWLADLGKYENVAAKPQTEQPVKMVHEEIEELWAPIAKDDDWQAFEDKLSALRGAV